MEPVRVELVNSDGTKHRAVTIEGGYEAEGAIVYWFADVRVVDAQRY